MRKLRRLVMGGALAVALALGAVVAAPVPALAGGGGGSQGGDYGFVDLYRLYNPYTGEHFYTTDAAERDSLAKVGWSYEGVGWSGLTKIGDPVYRLYNPYAPGGDHHYTKSKGEYDELQKLGWKGEGSSWKEVSYPDIMSYPVYRLYNPNAKSGAHHYTTDEDEAKALVAAGWKDEGVGWRASGTRRFLLDGTQSKLVENARVFLGVPTDPTVTYYTEMTYYYYYDGGGISGSHPIPGRGDPSAVTVDVHFLSDSHEQSASVDMNQDGTVYTRAGATKWNGDHVYWTEDGKMVVY